MLLMNSIRLCVIIPAGRTVFAATGCVGGYHSAEFLFRHPDVFDSVIALGSIYDAAHRRCHAGTQSLHEASPGGLQKGWRIVGSGTVQEQANHYLHRSRVLGEDSIRHTRMLEQVLGQKGFPWVDC